MKYYRVLFWSIVCVLFLFATGAIADGSHDAILNKDGKARVLQYEDAISVNIRKDLQAKLRPIVAAIRYAENGGHGLEYGIIHKRVKYTYRSQAGWCAATVQKHWDRYTKAGGKSNNMKGFIVSLGKRYCPINAKNDPKGLNKNWVRNVSSFYKRFSTNKKNELK